MTKREKFIIENDLLKNLEYYDTEWILKDEIDEYIKGNISDELMKKIILMSREKAENARYERMGAVVELLHNRPEDLSNIYAILEYRKERIWQGKLLKDKKEMEDPNKIHVNYSETKMQYIKSELIKSDERRSSIHDKCLANYSGMMKDMARLNINPKYSVNVVDSSECVRATMDQNIRKEMTDWILQFCCDLEEVTTSRLLEKYPEYNEGIDSLRKAKMEIYKQYREHNNLTIKRDNGDVSL